MGWLSSVVPQQFGVQWRTSRRPKQSPAPKPDRCDLRVTEATRTCGFAVMTEKIQARERQSLTRSRARGRDDVQAPESAAHYRSAVAPGGALDGDDGLKRRTSGRCSRVNPTGVTRSLSAPFHQTPITPMNRNGSRRGATRNGYTVADRSLAS